MATCAVCHRVMLVANTCVHAAIEIQGTSYVRIRYGQETLWDGSSSSLPERCWDCGVAPGGLHHLHCEVEQCPKCGAQLIACACSAEPTRPLDTIPRRSFEEVGRVGDRTPRNRR